MLDALAQSIAARQWEPVTNDRIAALRLWARGWMLARRRGAQDANPDIIATELSRTYEDTVRLHRVGSFPPVPVPLAARYPGLRPPRTFARPRAEVGQARRDLT